MRIPKRRLLLAGAAWCASAALSPSLALAQDGPPSLVVMVVVDQLGGEAFNQFAPALQGGLRRMLEQGRSYTQASHAHAMTETAPGHATLATGVVPARHGIVANAWRQKAGFDWQTTYAVGDAAAPLLGYENEPELEGASPKNLLRDGLADWVRAQDPDARTVAISKKDRTTVTMAGRDPTNAWWILEQLGVFVTSTYYENRYPGWLTRFNEQVMPGISAPREWRSEVPSTARSLARDDAARYEGDGRHTTFPHRASEEVDENDIQAVNIWAYDQPRADDAVLALAKVAIAEHELGQREGHVDFLALSFAAFDRVGHYYGPKSQEALSTLIHVDGVLDELFRFLDEQVGEGRWVVGLAGDHGSQESPEAERQAGHRDAERIDEAELVGQLSVAMRDVTNTGVNPVRMAEDLADRIVSRGLAEATYTHRELMFGGEPADTFEVLYRNSYYPGRAWGLLSRFGLELRFGERDLVSTYPTGTSHGSAYWYDRHVPMMFLGAGVVSSTSDEPVYTVDFAPTLAGLAGIRVPDDLDGRRLF